MLPLLAVLAFGAFCLLGTTDAEADGRFGDSTWVAPEGSFHSEFTTDGPRVARADDERGWETALRTPFRIVFLPLRIVARGLEAGAGKFGPRLLEPQTQGPPKPGPSLGLNVAYSSLSDIGVGPGVTWVGFPVAGARLHLTGSLSAIDRRRAHVSETIGYLRPIGLRLSLDYDRKPNRRFYGIGNNTSESDRSYYLLETTSAEAAFFLGASRLRQFRIVGGYSSMSPRSGDHGEPPLEDVFTPAQAPYERQATRELWYGATAELARLDDGRDPSRGAHGRVDLRRVVGVRSADPDFMQWQMETRAYVPVFAKRRVIAVRGVYAGVDPRGDATTTLPFYRLSRSEGATRFAGYAPERFRDRQLLLGRIEYRWTILRRMSAVALYEVGEVAPSAASFTLRNVHESYGGGLRLGLSEDRTLRFELAKSVEGLHAVLALGRGF